MSGHSIARGYFAALACDISENQLLSKFSFVTLQSSFYELQVIDCDYVRETRSREAMSDRAPFGGVVRDSLRV